jgi:hypothetical protein
MFTKNLYFSMLVALFLMAASSMAAWAQSAKATELQTYLQQLEQDKLQYSNNPDRYQEYERKIAAIRAELGDKGTVSNVANTTTDSKEQAAETEQARMARTLSSDDYAKWKMANAPLAKIEKESGPMAKTANTVIEQKQDLEGTNPQKFAHKRKSNNVDKMPYSAEQKQANIMRVEEAMKKAQSEHNTELVRYYEQILLNFKK